MAKSCSTTFRSIQTLKARRLLVIGLLVSALVLFAWTMFGSSTQETSTPVSLDKAGTCPISLPPTARNIQYRVHRQWIRLDERVRFQAPVADCIPHATTVIKECQARFGPQYPVEQEMLTRMQPPEGFMNSYRFSSPPWFDVWNISNGLEVGGGGAFRPKIWIDTDRGVFYYELSD